MNVLVGWPEAKRKKQPRFIGQRGLEVSYKLQVLEPSFSKSKEPVEVLKRHPFYASKMRLMSLSASLNECRPFFVVYGERVSFWCQRKMNRNCKPLKK